MALLQQLKKIRFGLASVFLAAAILIVQGTAEEITNGVPTTSRDVVVSLKSAQWNELEEGFSVIRGISQTGVIFTAFRISPEQFDFSIVSQSNSKGSRVKEIGEEQGAVLATNAGFFAQRLNGDLYPIGYLKLNGETISKGWKSNGGVVSIDNNNSLKLEPTHWGLPTETENSLQSRPMLIEPEGNWAMGSNLGEAKNRTLLCKMDNGEIILAAVTRVGMSLYEAGWVMREKQVGGFFGCDAALALDGGRSTQVWYSEAEKYSFSGSVPVQNFLVVHSKQN